MPGLQQLYDVLVRDRYYNASFEDFQKQMHNTDYQQQVYDVITRDKLFNAGKRKFASTYLSGLKPKKVEEPIVEEVVEEVKTEEEKPYLKPLSSLATLTADEPWTMVKKAKEVSLVKEEEEEEKAEKLQKQLDITNKNVAINRAMDMNPAYQAYQLGSGLYRKYFPKEEEEDVDDGLTTEEKQQKYEKAADKHGHDLYKNVESSWWNLISAAYVKRDGYWESRAGKEAMKRKWAGETVVGEYSEAIKLASVFTCLSI